MTVHLWAVTNRWLRYIEHFFDIVRQAHYNDTGHSGAKKTLVKVSPTDSNIPCTQHYNADCTLHRFRLSIYSCLPRAAVDKFVTLRFVCQRMVPQSHKGPLKPTLPKVSCKEGRLVAKRMNHNA